MTDESVPLAERVASLLAEMTLAEKAGQVCGTFLGQMRGRTNGVSDVEQMLDDHHLGAVSPFGVLVSPVVDPQEAADVTNHLQRHAVEGTRLGIPLLVPVDAVHGHAYVDGATVFPHNLGLAATWDPELAERVASVTASELAATGATTNYSPTCDVARDPRWGRTFETFGESPRLVADMAAAKVRGYQGDSLGAPDSVAATAKHFPAYSQPSRGEDAAPVDVSPTTLRRVFLPPFAAAVDAGVASVMPSYNSLDGEPVHGSGRLLTELLREELGFDGVVASDWNGVAMLHEDHRTTESAEGAVGDALGAGVDLASVGGPAAAAGLVRLVESGRLPESVLDAHVRRILATKVRLGLFEDPYVNAVAAPEYLGNDAHRALARAVTTKSLTLLKNEAVLPLDPDLDEILVTGPNADRLRNQLGGWSVADRPGTGVTVRDGVAAAVSDGTTVTHHRGATLRDEGDLETTRRAAARADAAVVVLGEGWYIHEFGPRDVAGGDRESFPNRHRLELPAAQRRLLETVWETGTPTVLTLVTGRPLALSWAAEHVPAILLAYYPGTEGGRAVADVLFGNRDPGGRLPISIPRSAGHLPTRFNHLRHPHPIGEDEHPPSYDPLFAFGHGESYASFEYADLTLSPATVAPDETTTASLAVENVSSRHGETVVQAYVTDEYASRVRPVRELAAYERVSLSPGEERRVTLPVGPDALGYRTADGDLVVEPGEFTLRVEDHSRSLTVED